MATIQKAIVICDTCGKTVANKNKIRTDGYPNEGCSEIKCGRVTVLIDEGDYCNLDCFVAWLTQGINQTKEA